MRDWIVVVKADWNNGIRKRLPYFAVVSFIAGILGNNYLNSAAMKLEYMNLTERPSVAECFLYLFRGMREFNPQISGSFELPVTFVIFNLFLAYMIGDYIVRDINEFGIQLLIKSKRKYVWWISKLVWNIATVVLFYVSVGIGITVAWLINGAQGGLFTIHAEVVRYTVGKEFVAFGEKAAAAVIFSLIFVSIAVSMCQMAASLYIKPIISFMAVAVVYIFSGFYMSQWLIGNYLMIYRNGLITENGVNFVFGIIMAAVIASASCILGYVLFRRRDLL